MKKFCWHCWHEIPNTRRTITRISKCKRIGETIIHERGAVSCAYYKRDEECCKCFKKRTIILDDHDISRAGGYPTEKEYEKTKTYIKN